VRRSEEIGQPGAADATAWIVELPSGPSVVFDCQLAGVFLVGLRHNTLVLPPANPRAGAFHLMFRQADSRPRTASWAGAFAFNDGAPTLSRAKGALDIVRVDIARKERGYSMHGTLLSAQQDPLKHAAAGIYGQGELATMTLAAAVEAMLPELRRRGLDIAPAAARRGEPEGS
jgi:hypothetical protein